MQSTHIYNGNDNKQNHKYQLTLFIGQYKCGEIKSPRHVIKKLFEIYQWHTISTPYKSNNICAMHIYHTAENKETEIKKKQ